MVQKDVIDGYVSLESAKMDYGVIINPKTFEINLNATKKLRENIHVRKI